MADRSSPLRVLCLDLETGLGGSSRSLLLSLRHMDRSRVSVEVWRGGPSPIEPQLDQLGIPWRYSPGLPKVKALRRPSRNLVVLGRAALDFRRCRQELARLADEARHRFDLVHFNLDSMTAVAAWLRHKVGLPAVMHLRSIMPVNAFARVQAMVIAKATDHRIAISENERDNFLALAPDAAPPTVIHNIVELPPLPPQPLPELAERDGFRVACLSNFVWARGTDRLIPLARELARRDRRDIRFVVAGNTAVRERLDGELGVIAAQGGTLADYARLHDVADMFVFLGHVGEPERVLAACDALIKPTREANPWGRDILEAMSQAKPVISVGSYRQFVESGTTGLLQADFDVAGAVDFILRLADDRGLCRRMGEAAQARVAELCNGPARAAELLAVWEGVARR